MNSWGLVSISVATCLLIPIRPGSGQKAPVDRNPELVFEHVWRTLDRTYGRFPIKQVDWNTLYNVYRPGITPTTTDKDLHETLLAMLHHLNDGHVCIDGGSSRLCAELADDLPMDAFSLDLVMSKDLDGNAKQILDGSFTFGWLEQAIGSLHIADFKGSSPEVSQAIDEVLATFASASGIIVDVRNNPGGTSHRHTESAAEGFTLAMRVLPHVTVVGDPTAGALSAQYPEKLENGWTLWVAYKHSLDPDAVCWDGIGIPPDLRIKNTRSAIESGTDGTLEFATTLLEVGELQTQIESRSVASLKTSIVDQFVEKLEDFGLEAAVAELEFSIGNHDDKAYLCAMELLELGRGCLRSTKYPNPSFY